MGTRVEWDKYWKPEIYVCGCVGGKFEHEDGWLIAGDEITVHYVVPECCKLTQGDGLFTVVTCPDWKGVKDEEKK